MQLFCTNEATITALLIEVCGVHCMQAMAVCACCGSATAQSEETVQALFEGGPQLYSYCQLEHSSAMDSL
jgi:hypothetical protein